MSALRNQVISNQRACGLIHASGMEPKPADTISQVINPPQPKAEVSETQVIDGYWIVLQDWSQCNMKCGGGTSTLQRVCVPPKNGGAPCQGDLVINRSCNTEPCPNVYESTQHNPDSNIQNIVLPPTVKVMTFSSRPQRYSVTNQNLI